MMGKVSEHGKILALGAASLFLGLAWTFLFYKQGVGLNYPLFILLIIVCGIGLTSLFARKVDRLLYGIIGLALFFATMVFVRESDLLTFFNIVGSLLLLLVVVGSLTTKHITKFLSVDYVKVLFLPFRFILPFFTTFSEIVSLRKVVGESARSKEIVRGGVMAFIALLVFSLLFAAADPVFERVMTLISNYLSSILGEDSVHRIVLSAFVTAFFIGGFGYVFRKTHTSSSETSMSMVRNLGAVETMILFGSIDLLFFVFIALQIAHFFGGQTNLVEQGLTYAEYARKGFFELVIVAVLSYLIVSFAEKQIVRKEEKHLHSFKILSGVLVVEVVLILVSAFMRLSLYEEAYGFTVIRLYSHAFMIWLGVVLFLLSRHIWMNGKREVFVFRTFCSVILLLLAMNAVNPDVFIAQKNIERYQASGKIDAAYLGGLSSDALPYTIGLLDDPNEKVRNEFGRSLYSSHYSRAVLDGNEARKNSWQMFHLSRSTAEKLLGPNQEALEKFKLPYN